MRVPLLIIAFIFLSLTNILAQDDLESLLLDLDNKLLQSNDYVQDKIGRIEGLKTKRNSVLGLSLEKEYELNLSIYNEYKNFISDSAIFYISRNIDISDKLADPLKAQHTRITSSLLFVRLGMYKEATELLENIDTNTLIPSIKKDYYKAYRELNLGMGQYSQNVRNKSRYWQSANYYNELVSELVPKNSDEFIRIQEKNFRLEGAYDKALIENDKRLKLTNKSSEHYALVTFHRSLIYRGMGDTENEMKNLALSAIADIKQATRDNASISILADLLKKKGDVNRAYKYIRFSLDNIKEYNTRIRSAEVLNIMSIIDQEYQIRNEKKNNELKTLLFIACVLSVLLVISVIYVYKEMKKVQAISHKLKDINGELESFNAKLHSMNNELKARNLEVAEANHIKEEYIAYFLDQCSKYIVKLDNYRKMVYKKLNEKQYDELLKTTRDNTLKDTESKELFANFDTMFINLFPDFLDRFNELLVEDEQIVLKKEEVLNTELRIYALIRLGICDSSKIANFLGYSVNTIYNYRTKMKNKSRVSRDDFELHVKKIGAFS